MNPLYTAIALIGLLSSGGSFQQGAIRVMPSATTRAEVQAIDPQAAEVVTGQVVRVVEIARKSGKKSLCHLTVKRDSDKQLITVYFAPGWNLNEGMDEIKTKDRVEIRGTKMTKGGKPALLAAEVKRFVAQD